MQAETLTFQKLSFKSYTKRCSIILFGYSHNLEIAQQAILLGLLFTSHKHFDICSIDSKA